MRLNRANRRAPRSIAEQIADACGLSIMEGRLRAGDRLIEQQVAERFSVSRGPVRDAFHILERRRLVDILPRRGAFVRSITLESVADQYGVRIALATYAAGHAARDPSPGLLAALERRLAEIRAAAEGPEGDPPAIAFALGRACHALVRAGGNELAEQIWAELNDHSFWTTLWKIPLEGATPEIRRRRADQFADTLAALRARRPDAAERSVRLWMEEGREGALEALRRMRPGPLAGPRPDARARPALAGPRAPAPQG
ncbi:transcriptional regulator, GntR family [Albimonas pacifica]|uniref:Transcriptional regulator, GntR family n=1 Tax=Albimonas pacifica TaxID=1114924 RepID=A0A1I3FBS6_9RHOB|nr:transcriptional regulator, GntR family [Albimonas pacifica]